MLLAFTILAVVIAMMGVFGLVTLSTRQRTKEIGIRKVNGAHSGGIVKMFCLEYLKWVGIAFVPACPLGYLFMYHWLDEFAYRTTMSWWLFWGRTDYCGDYVINCYRTNLADGFTESGEIIEI